MNRLALSVRQPWAWAIASGLKDVENRSWGTSYRGRIFIHASKQYEGAGEDWMRELGIVTPPHSTLHRGAIIGEVDILDCRHGVNSPWALPGQYHWRLGNAYLYEKPIPYKGRLGLFPVSLP